MTEGSGKKDRGAKNITLPNEVHRRAKMAAAGLGITLQEFVGMAVSEKLEALEAHERKIQAVATIQRKHRG